MKKLTKIKLINWYTFTNETIDISGNSLVTGANGSGKSTLLDAIQFVLTAGEGKFNKAADEKSKRTIETYVRCKVNTESKEFLRDGDVTGYIALELRDDKRIDIIGACIECTKGSKPAKTFFKISSQELKDELFINDKKIKTLNEFKKENYVEYFTQVNETKKMLKSVLGINDDRYFTLLTKSLAFKPIEDINEFVDKFLLEEQKVNLDSLYQNIHSFREIKKAIEEENNKIEFLLPLEEKHQNYLELQKNNNFYEWAKNKTLILNNNNQIKQLDNEIEKIKIELDIKNNKKEILQNEINSLNDRLLRYINNNENKGDFNLFKEVTSKINQLEQEILYLKKDVNNFDRHIKLEKNIDSSLKINKLLNFDIKDDKSNNTLLEYKNILYDLEVKNKNEYNDYKDRQKQVLIKKEQIESKLNKLNKNQMPYPEYVIKLKDEINKQLKEKYDTLINVRPVCEYIEIKDEEYRNIIEGYLNTQKFDLIVEPKYFNEAIRIYEDFKNENSVYGIGIINVSKLKVKEELQNSLYSKLDIKNEYAKLYMNNLLSKVVCVDDVQNLKNYEISVTKSCMTYKNNVVRKINPKNYEDAYIGTRAQEIQLKKLKESLLDINNLLEEIKKTINKKEVEINRIDSSNIKEILEEHKQYKMYLSKQKELENNQNDLKEYERDDIFKDLIKKQNEIENEIKEKNSIIEKIRQEISNLVNKKELKQSNKETLSKEIEELTYLKNKLTIESDYEEKYLAIKDKNIEKIQNDNLIKQAELKSYIENIEKNYNEKYSFDEIPNFSNVQRYLEILYNMRERELKEYQEACNDLEKKCEISFKEDFVNKISGYIENACDHIKELNRNLKKHQFGNEKYEFIYKPSIDYNFSKYYEIITSGKVYNSNTLFDEELSDREREIMDELFRMITTNYSEESVNKTLDNYTDYRKYMSYDIKVTNTQGDCYYFSKVSKEKSGGEIQTPCYVMIAASFDELRKNTIRDNSVGCIVLFDEAFNKMDDMRINTLMEFYNKLNIQLIISTPPDKLASISPYVDTNMIVLKDNNRSEIKVCTKEELDEL